MRKLCTILIFSLVTLCAQAQAVVYDKNDGESYYNGTEWGPEMRHYSYYFVRYNMAVPLQQPVGEMPLGSGNWAIGISYKLKVVSIWDIGVDLSYENEFHRMKNLPNTRSIVPEVSTFDKVRTYQNNITGAFYTRFYFKQNRDHDFGWYIDGGAYYSYVAGWGFVKKNNTKLERIKLRSKRDVELENQNYGVFLRMGYNQFAIFARYNMADVFANEEVVVTPFSVGLQLNLVMF
ncbi:MAG: hypothetical protein KBB11_05345 [Bacteroidales bacterium]|nr:hypothetical protein [Bacteroidales bacterium]HOY38538.1 hypothetical protein [Bacteroidales bacterium]HQP03087.1 hypothetical protein [Bacteroidales bacterium]